MIVLDKESLAHEIQKIILQAHRRKQKDKSIYTKKDLGLKAVEKIYPSSDRGITDKDLQKKLDKIASSVQFHETEKERIVKKFIQKQLSKGFYGYLKLRKILGFTKESLKIKSWYAHYINDCINLINPGGILWAAEGIIPLTSKINMPHAGVSLEGTGRASTIEAELNNMKIIDVTASWCKIGKVLLRTKPGITPVEGSVGLNITPTTSIYNVISSELVVEDVYDAIVLGKVYGVGIHDARINNVKRDGVRITDANDQILSRIVADNVVKPTSGAAVNIKKSGAVWIADCDWIDFYNGLLADPVTNNRVDWFWITNTCFDNADADGVVITNINGGSVSGFYFTNGWASGSKRNGINLRGVDVSCLNAVHVQDNQFHGVLVDTGCYAAKIADSEIKNNNLAAGLYDGIHVAAGVSWFEFINNIVRINHHFDIEVASGGSDNYVIMGCITGPAGIHDGGTGGNKLVIYHSGYVPHPFKAKRFLIDNNENLQFKNSIGEPQDILGIDAADVVRLKNPTGLGLHINPDSAGTLEISHNSSGDINIGSATTKPANFTLDVATGIYLKKAASTKLIVDDSVKPQVNIIPAGDAALMLGSTANRFHTIYAWDGKFGNVYAGGSIIIDNSRILQNIVRCATDLLPNVDNTGSVGTGTLRWNLIHGVSIISGDFQLENKIKLIEAEKLGFPKGLAFLNAKGKVLMILDEKGNLRVAGKIKQLKGAN